MTKANMTNPPARVYPADHWASRLPARIYNGLDVRRGFPIILTKPIAQITPPHKSWWRRLLGF